MSWLRLPLRLARRETLRRPGRTALVALLVAIPVAGMALAVTLIRSEAETPAEDWAQANGQADATAFEDGAALALPVGSRTVEIQSTYGRMKDAEGRRADGAITNLPIGDPITEGIYELVEGRAAATPGEAVLTTALADRFDVHTGDELHLERPELHLTVVGEAESSDCLRCDALLVHGDLDAIEALARLYGGTVPHRVLIDLPDDMTEQEQHALVGETNPQGLTLRVDELVHQYVEVDGDSAVRWSLVIGAVVLMVIAIVISAAFAVGARRQLVTLGQLSASGAPPSTIRAALVLQGTVTGLVGSVIGLVLAAGVLLTLRDTIEWRLDQRLRGYELPPGELLAVVLIGVTAATASALVPARTAARIPTLAALAGRRPLSPVPPRLVAWGFASVATGLGLLFLAVLGGDGGGSGDVWAYVAILGGALELFGACALAPAIVARLEPLSTRLRGALRLGARALARHRARTGAVVSAVAAAGALAVVAGALVLASERQERNDVEIPDDVVVANVERYDAAGYPTFAPLSPEVEEQLARAVPDARSAPLHSVAFDLRDGMSPGWEMVEPLPDDVYLGADRAYVVDEALLDAVRADGDVRAALREHGIVLLNPEVGGIDVVLSAPTGARVETPVVRHRYSLGWGGHLLVTAERAAALDGTVTTAGTLLHLPDALDDEGRDRLEDLTYELDESLQGGPESQAYVQVTWLHDAGGPTTLQLELLLTGVALLFCLFVIGVSLALAAAEGKDERDILAIAGAPPAMVARSAGARAWLMATIGAAIAVPIGFLPVVVGRWALDSGGEYTSDFPVVFPARTVALLLVVVPLVVCAVAWCASSTAQRLRPVRVSTATFE